MNKTLLMQEFEKIFGKTNTKEILFEFEKTKSAHWSGDITKTLLHSARFCEVCIACLKQISNQSIKVDLNKIEFGKYYNELIKL